MLVQQAFVVAGVRDKAENCRDYRYKEADHDDGDYIVQALTLFQLCIVLFNLLLECRDLLLFFLCLCSSVKSCKHVEAVPSRDLLDR